jgi:hypothetical protein
MAKVAGLEPRQRRIPEVPRRARNAMARSISIDLFARSISIELH